jgi:hypothetical protein
MSQLAFIETELERLTSISACEEMRRSTWVSPMFLVPKGDTWRLIIDLRHLNKFCKDFSVKYETLKKLRHMAKQNDWCFSLDLLNEYDAVGIREQDRDFFTVNYRGRLLRLACLPMGWNASPYVFCMSTRAMIRYLRSPLLAMGNPKTPSKKNLRGRKWKGLKLLPFLDDYCIFFYQKQGTSSHRSKSCGEYAQSVPLIVYPSFQTRPHFPNPTFHNKPPHPRTI